VKTFYTVLCNVPYRVEVTCKHFEIKYFSLQINFVFFLQCRRYFKKNLSAFPFLQSKSHIFTDVTVRSVSDDHLCLHVHCSVTRGGKSTLCEHLHRNFPADSVVVEMDQYYWVSEMNSSLSGLRPTKLISKYARVLIRHTANKKSQCTVVTNN